MFKELHNKIKNNLQESEKKQLENLSYHDGFKVGVRNDSNLYCIKQPDFDHATLLEVSDTNQIIDTRSFIDDGNDTIFDLGLSIGEAEAKYYFLFKNNLLADNKIDIGNFVYGIKDGILVLADALRDIRRQEEISRRYKSGY